jgi:2-amino-4-hydroxy-6-hydroxymethyldihydropteridine diphosphokinase
MILLALGSNLASSFGDRYDNIDCAVKELSKHNFKIVKKSSFYETPSYPNIKNPKFINIVILVEAKLTPQKLASSIIKIEELLERKRFKKNDPRTCDIDIIDYNNEILNFKFGNLDFDVPHKNLIYRNFVLFPIKEIIPDWKHPESNVSIDVLIDQLSHDEKNSILKINKS